MAGLCVRCRLHQTVNAEGICSYCTPREPGRRLRLRIAQLEAEVARLEALIVEQGASSFVTDETYAEAAAIRSRR